MIKATGPPRSRNFLSPIGTCPLVLKLDDDGGGSTMVIKLCAICYFDITFRSTPFSLAYLIISSATETEVSIISVLFCINLHLYAMMF